MGVRATILAGMLLLSACSFMGPRVTCQSIDQDACDRAVELARPLLDAYWNQAIQVLVHPGGCTRSMVCSARQRSLPGVITVELVSDLPDEASVAIDRQTAEWTANCRLIVRDDNGAHGEPCAED